jgi:hypothetical protein
MSNGIKSGKEILDDFFDGIEDIPGVDNKIASILKNLYRDDKLTDSNLSNALFNQRKDELKDEA